LAATENRLAVERMRYNARVQQYDTSRRQSPAVATAFLFNFRDYPFFLVQVPERAGQVPKSERERQPQREP